jgi:hypothetical protein
MRKIWVYISGPISKGGSFHNVHNGCVAFHTLLELGFIPICPHWSALQDMVCPLPYEAWIAYDLELLTAMDAVLRLPGESVGADRECEEAGRLQLPVFHSIKELQTWASTLR